jgi:hypothetical protein
MASCWRRPHVHLDVRSRLRLCRRDQKHGLVRGRLMQNLIFALNLISAVAAFVAALFWFLSAAGKLPYGPVLGCRSADRSPSHGLAERCADEPCRRQLRRCLGPHDGGGDFARRHSMMIALRRHGCARAGGRDGYNHDEPRHQPRSPGALAPRSGDFALSGAGMRAGLALAHC